jgi:hypothetical protein
VPCRLGGLLWPDAGRPGGSVGGVSVSSLRRLGQHDDIEDKGPHDDRDVRRATGKCDNAGQNYLATTPRRPGNGCDERLRRRPNALIKFLKATETGGFADRRQGEPCRRVARTATTGAARGLLRTGLAVAVEDRARKLIVHDPIEQIGDQALEGHVPLRR